MILEPNPILGFPLGYRLAIVAGDTVVFSKILPIVNLYYPLEQWQREEREGTFPSPHYELDRWIRYLPQLPAGVALHNHRLAGWVGHPAAIPMIYCPPVLVSEISRMRNRSFESQSFAFEDQTIGAIDLAKLPQVTQQLSFSPSPAIPTEPNDTHTRLMLMAMSLAMHHLSLLEHFTRQQLKC